MEGSLSTKVTSVVISEAVILIPQTPRGKG